MKRGYPLLLEFIENARFYGDVQEPWYAVEMIHWLELRRYEILAAGDEDTIASLYCDIFLDHQTGEPLKLCDEIRHLYLNSPLLLMEEREVDVLASVFAEME